MHSGLAFIMANHGKVKPNNIVFDPFVGTGICAPPSLPLQTLSRKKKGNVLHLLSAHIFCYFTKLTWSSPNYLARRICFWEYAICTNILDVTKEQFPSSPSQYRSGEAYPEWELNNFENGYLGTCFPSCW